MLKITAETSNGGTAFLFGLSEANLNILEFDGDPIFFDFGYVGRPDLYGLIVYLPTMLEESWDALDRQRLMEILPNYIDPSKGIIPESLRLIVLTKPVLHRLRTTPFWGQETHIEIKHPNDIQIVFSGRTEAEIQAYLIDNGFIPPPQPQSKGFKPR